MSFIEKLLCNFLPMIACENCKQFLLTTITAPNSARWCEAGWKLLQIYLLEPCVVSLTLRLSWETFSDTILMLQVIPQHSSFRHIHCKRLWDGIYEKDKVKKNEPICFGCGVYKVTDIYQCLFVAPLKCCIITSSFYLHA